MTIFSALLLGIVLGAGIAFAAFYVRARKLPAFPMIPLTLNVAVRGVAPGYPARMDEASIDLPTGQFPTDAHLVTHDGEIAYHGPDSAHALRVEQQLLAREVHGVVSRQVNGIEQEPV